MIAQIKLIQFLQTLSEQGKKLQFLVTSNICGLKSRDSRTFSEKNRMDGWMDILFIDAQP